MRLRTWLLFGLMWGGASLAFAATPPSPPKAKPAVLKMPAAKTPAKPAAAPAKPKAGKAQTGKTQTASPSSASAAKPATGAKTGHEGPRTLQDIHIEGEIPVPQVLFITARDQRRFLDFQHRRYLKTSQQVGEQTVLPSWIGVTGQQPTDARKENPR